MNSSIGELQYEYLMALLSCNKTMTIKQALYRMNTLNEYVARYRTM